MFYPFICLISAFFSLIMITFFKYIGGKGGEVSGPFRRIGTWLLTSMGDGHYSRVGPSTCPRPQRTHVQAIFFHFRYNYLRKKCERRSWGLYCKISNPFERVQGRHKLRQRCDAIIPTVSFRRRHRREGVPPNHFSGNFRFQSGTLPRKHPYLPELVIIFKISSNPGGKP